MRRIIVLQLAALCACATARPFVQQGFSNVAAGIGYLAEGECELAEERCRLALEYGEDNPEAYNCLGLVALRCRANVAEAADHFKQALALNEDFAEAHNNLGTCFLRSVPANYELACESFNAALEINPSNLDARENLGSCYERRGALAADESARAEYYKSARSQLIRLVEMDPVRIRALAILGVMDLTEGKNDRAVATFARCLEIAPHDATCQYNMGNAMLALADCTQAVRAFIGAIHDDPPHGQIAVPARKNLGVAYEMCAKRDRAYAEFIESIKDDPGNPDHHFDLGKIFAERGLFGEAENEWENTLRLEPGYCPAYYALAMRANAALNTEKTIGLCSEYVTCEVARAPNIANEQVAHCKELVTNLALH